jgi:DNA polymerase III delta subunit
MRVFLSGDFEDYKKFIVSQVKQQKVKDGYEIREASGTDKDFSSLMETSLFLNDPVMVIVTDAHKLPTSICNEICASSFEILMVGTGKLKGTILNGLDMEIQDKPKPNKMDDWCILFLKKHLGGDIKVSDDLLKAVVKRVGYDLGQLYFEALKYRYVVGEDKVLNAKDVASVMAVLGEADGKKVIDAIKSSDVRSFLKSADELARLKGGDPLFSFLGLFTYNVCLWFDVAMLLEQKIDNKKIAEILKLNPWFLENFVLPVVKNFGLKKISELIKLGADSEYAVFNNERDAWTKFKVGVIKILDF